MSTTSYKKQAIGKALKRGIPLEGTDHIYIVNALLWPKVIEKFIGSLLIGKSLHVCCGKSTLGDLRVDMFEDTADLKADARKMPLPDKSFDTVLCDPPYNGKLQWNHDLLCELARLAKTRIIFQHWFMPGTLKGFYKKDNTFKINQIYLWQPKTYFGRVNVVSVWDKITTTTPDKIRSEIK